MSCIGLIGGLIGCGKSTLISYLEENNNSFFNCKNSENEKGVNGAHADNKIVCKIVLDELCPMEEQAEMMKSLKGWKCFRADLLMAAEHFVSFLLDSKFVVHGPLTERSMCLLDKLKDINRVNNTKGNGFIFLSEDNFYYRSMRYEWFQLSKRANIGFCQIFLDCPLNVAISRNSARGYSIPEEKIRRMVTFLEYPDPEKYKWEKFSIIFDSSGKLDNESLKPIIALFDEAAKNPAEIMIMSDKIQAQSICSKNMVHQADKILRKCVSQLVASKRGQIPEEGLGSFISFVVHVRQTLLSLIRSGDIEFSRILLENLKSQGIDKVQKEFAEAVTEKFEAAINEKLFEYETLLPNADKESQFLLNLKRLNLNNSTET